jgi:hypothetical protein
VSNTQTNNQHQLKPRDGWLKHLAPEFFLALIVLGVYLETRIVSIGWVDAGDFSTAAALLTVPHPTGYPFTVLLMALAGRFPFSPPAASSLITVLSALVASVAAYCLLREILRPLGETWARLGALAGALALALAPLNWGLGTSGEIYPLALAGGLTVTWLALRLWRHPSPRIAGMLALCLGVLPWLHLTALVWMPAGLVALCKARKCFHPALSIVFLALGFSVGLYLPLRAFISEPGHWKVAARAEGLWEHIVGGQFKQHLSFDISLWGGRLKILWDQLILALPIPLLVVIPLAFVPLRRGISALWLLILPALVAELFAINYQVFDPQSYHLIALAVLCFLWGSGLAVLARFLTARWIKERMLKIIFTALVIVLFTAALIIRYPAMDLSGDQIAERYMHSALGLLPSAARLMPADIDNTFLAWNALQVEYKRPDLELRTINDLNLSLHDYYLLVKKADKATVSEPGAVMDMGDKEVISRARLAGCWVGIGGDEWAERASALWDGEALRLLADPSLRNDEAARRMLGSIYGDRALWRIQTVALEPGAAQSHWDGALADLLLALQFDPQSLNATVNLVYVLLKRGDAKSALAYARRAVELGPEQPQSWMALGTAARALGEHDEAQRAYERARELGH